MGVVFEVDRVGENNNEPTSSGLRIRDKEACVGCRNVGVAGSVLVFVVVAFDGEVGGTFFVPIFTSFIGNDSVESSAVRERDAFVGFRNVGVVEGRFRTLSLADEVLVVDNGLGFASGRVDTPFVLPLLLVDGGVVLGRLTVGDVRLVLKLISLDVVVVVLLVSIGSSPRGVLRAQALVPPPVPDDGGVLLGRCDGCEEDPFELGLTLPLDSVGGSGFIAVFTTRLFLV